MIDLVLLRMESTYKKTKKLIESKDPTFNVDRLLELYADVRQLRKSAEDLRCEKNELAQQGKTGVTTDLRSQSQQISIKLKEVEQELADKEVEFKALYLACPNVPEEGLPVGGKEANRLEYESEAEKPQFSFPVKNHVELGEKLGWFDFQQAATMTGSNFVFYKGEGVKLMYALTMLMLKNNIEHGFTPVLPPYLVNEKSLEVASNFPKFRDQVYSIQDDALYLSPTSEVNLTNVYRNHIFEKKDLPVRMTAWTSCFRREAGSYGAHERGLIRIHQFEKVELYTICEPSEAENEHKNMRKCAEDILQQLGLHYRVSLLATQDCSFPSAKTWDIEVWLPGQNAYYEVSSCSNCTDFQARRGLIRYRKSPAEAPELVYTLNASSLALPRLMAALMEVYQQPDGTIELPKVLTEKISVLFE